jgi:hypothetical protein
MKKISILFIAFIVLSFLMLLGCNNQNITNPQITPQPYTNKLDSDDKVSEIDWKSKYKVIRKVKFHVLINEYLDNNDKDNPNLSLLVREYWCFDGTGEFSQIYPVTNKIALDNLMK